MDFSEHDYLEKNVGNSETQERETANGGEKTHKAEDRDGKRSAKHKKGGDNEDDSSQRLKSMKSEDESRRYDRERSSLRHHSSLEHMDGSNRNRQEHRDRGKDWDNEKSREDRDRERDHDRERKEHNHESERKRDRDSERERFQRYQSHANIHRNEWDVERSGDKKNRDNKRERDLRERYRENRKYKAKKEEVAEPEVDPERDQRTVFAYQISPKADERDVYEFFSRAGKVRDVRLIIDRISKRSKGVGYIEFYDVMSVPMAIALSGQPLLGQLVMVKPSEAEKNLVQPISSASDRTDGLIGPYSGGARRLYVGNLDLNMKEELLRQVFEPFGAVELVQLATDLSTGHCKGYGFVQFVRLEDARASLTLDGQLEIAGKTIKVSAVTDQAGGQDAGDFDDDESARLCLNACSRALLMQKLDRTGTALSITGSPSTSTSSSTSVALPTTPIIGATPSVTAIVEGLPIAGLSVPNVVVPSFDLIGVPSECLLLKNMFDPKLETELDFDIDIKEDVEDECSRFGSLKHIYVDKNSAGFVYLRFEEPQSAISAQRALHGRWFAGKMITATFMLPKSYEARFPDSV